MSLKTRCALSVAGAFGALLVASVSAERIRETLEVDMPGVDDVGAVDTLTTGLGTAKVSVNTNSGKFKFRAKGTVENLSGETQVYKNDPEVEGHFEAEVGLGGDVTRSKYRVSAAGKAKARAKGTVPPPS